MKFADLVRLIQAIAWPVVVLTVAVLFRREIANFVQGLGGRISRLSAVGVTLELAATEPAKEALRELLKEIKEPSSTGPAPRSGEPSLLELAKASAPADYIIIDLREGRAWLTSRLYLFAVVLPPVLALRCFVFIGTRGPVPRYFLGLASPESVARALERRYSWLRQAMFEAHLRPLIEIYDSKRYVSWNPYNFSDNTKASLKSLIEGSAPEKWDLPQADALGEIVQALVDPIDLFQPGQVETFVARFLKNPELRRPHNTEVLEKDWVHLDKVDEHAHWIGDERHLLDLFGDDLRREPVVDDSKTDDEALRKAVLRKRGGFVAVTDPEGRFIRLIDRAALLEKVAAG